jgi:ligand-binding sensor domain-containing protein/anti-sigma regulatory factor (Ser/Thr protein kinase)
MWFSSYDGLYKHEGARIRTYNRVGKDSAAISNNEIHGLYEDQKGFIWIGTTAGIDKIDPVSGLITHYKINIKGKGISSGYVYGIFQDKDQFIWVACDAGMYRFNYETGVCQAINIGRDAFSVPSSVTGYHSSFATKQGLWIQTTEGTVLYDYKTGKFHHRFHNPDNRKVFQVAHQRSVGAGSDLCPDKKGGFYFLSGREVLIHYNPQTDKVDSYRFSHPPDAWPCCYSMAMDYKGNVWIGYRHGGLIIFQPDKKSFVHVRYENNNSLIGSNYIHSIAEDYNGKMWVSTDRNLYIIDLYNKSTQLNNLSEAPDFVRLKHNSGIMSMDEAGNLYIPFFTHGVFRYNTQTNETREFTLRGQPGNWLSYIYADKDKLFGGIGNRLANAVLKEGALQFINSTTLLSRALARYPHSIVWVYRRAEHDIYMKRSGGELYHFIGKDSMEKMQCSGFMKNVCVSVDSQSIYFINGDLDLVQRDLATRKMKIFPLYSLVTKSELPFSNPRDITEDRHGNIWITSQNGLLRYHMASGRVFNYTTQNGLQHNFTYAVIADRSSDVWVASLSGIDLYDRKANVFNQAFRLRGATYMDAFGSVLQAPDGKLYFNAGNKLVTIDPSLFHFGRKQKNLQINEVQVNGKNVDWSAAAFVRQMKHYQNKVLVRFGLLDFTEQERINYYYRLEGLDTTWTKTDLPGEVTFSALQPGSYSLHLKATDLSGSSVEGQSLLKFRILPPFWKTWWFYAMIAIIIIAVAWILIHQRIRSIKTRLAIRQQLTELEGRALRAQMNPHFIFNALNAIQECIVTQKIDEAYEYLSRFSKLLRLVLNNSEKNLISLSSELEVMRLYLSLEALRFRQSFSWEIELDEDLDTEEIKAPPMLLQPYIENAIWHGLRHKEGNQQLFIRIKEYENALLVEIEDNGVGRDKAAKIKRKKIGAEQFDSKGTALAKHRMEILSGQYAVDINERTEDVIRNGEIAGTKVSICIPLNL